MCTYKQLAVGDSIKAVLRSTGKIEICLGACFFFPFFVMPFSLRSSFIVLTITDSTLCTMKESNQLQFKITVDLCHRKIEMHT